MYVILLDSSNNLPHTHKQSIFFHLFFIYIKHQLYHSFKSKSLSNSKIFRYIWNVMRFFRILTVIFLIIFHSSYCICTCFSLHTSKDPYNKVLKTCLTLKNKKRDESYVDGKVETNDIHLFSSKASTSH